MLAATFASPAVSRRELLKGAAIVVGFSFAGSRAAMAQSMTPARRTLAPTEVDSFLALRPDGSVIVYSGKVDLGTGHRIAMRQMVGEELSVPVQRIELIEGDTALTPDQGSTSGSRGVTGGGAQLRQAAATLREGLFALAATRLQKPADSLMLVDGSVVASDGSKVSVAELVGDRPLNLKMNAKAPLKKPADFQLIGKPLARPDIPEKATGRHIFVHDFSLPGMLHARVVRPPAVGAKVLALDESSVAALPGVRVVRIKDFVAVVSPDEWAAIRAARELKVQWSDSAPLVTHEGVAQWARRAPSSARRPSSTRVMRRGSPRCRTRPTSWRPRIPGPCSRMLRSDPPVPLPM
jgi:nicotinate dehydrogenase subunit B